MITSSVNTLHSVTNQVTLSVKSKDTIEFCMEPQINHADDYIYIRPGSFQVMKPSFCCQLTLKKKKKKKKNIYIYIYIYIY